jgi:hypothetical protein
MQSMQPGHGLRASCAIQESRSLLQVFVVASFLRKAGMATMLLTEISVRALKGTDKNPKFFDTKTPGFGIRCDLKRKTWVVMRGKKELLSHVESVDP